MSGFAAKYLLFGKAVILWLPLKIYGLMFIGRHVSIAGGIDKAFDRAELLGCTAMQIFVTNPRGWELSRMNSQEIAEFSRKSRDTGIMAVAHMPYLPNIASSEKRIFSKSVESLVENARRCDELGIKYLVTHMGSHMGNGREKGLSMVARAVSNAIDSGIKAMILLENEAGHKNSVGDGVEELAKVYEMVGDRRLGFCLDTCHLFAYGYDIGNREVLDRMFETLDIGKVRAIHLNDAKKGLGSHLDRHANIGLGEIGTDRIGTFLGYGSISSKIIILETPVDKGVDEKAELQLAKSLMA